MTLLTKKNVFVTGGAGFIGSHLVDHLLCEGHQVTVYDNFSTGLTEFLVEAQKNRNFRLTKGDLLDVSTLTKAMEGIDFVFHLAANADVRFGLDHPGKDLEQNTLATFNVLEAMRVHKVGKIAFSSTGSIYGESPVIPTPEDAPFPIQTSLYGASKLACEGLIQAYAEGFGFQGWIFRFVSVLGERYTHGHLIDFYKQLLRDPENLFVLGDGAQKKSYFCVEDCIEAVLTAIDHSGEKVNIFNLGTDEIIEVNDSIRIISEFMGVRPALKYAGGKRGWIGDNPFILLDCRRIRGLGWKPRFSIHEGVLKTLHWLKENRWALDKR